MNQVERVQLLHSYKNGFAFLKEALDQLPPDMWKYKPTPNEWSIHEIVIHVSDTEVQSHVRCRTILAEPDTTIMTHEEYVWSVALNYLQRDVEEALAIISIMTSANFNLLQAVSESSWRNCCIYSVRGKLTLDDWLQTYANHIPQHIGQMQRDYEEWLAQKRV